MYSLSYVPDYDEVSNPNKDLYQDQLSGWDVEINNGEAYIKGVTASSDFIIDKDTIFVDTMNHKSYTGYDEVPDVKHADLAYVVENGVAQIVYIFDGDIYDANSIYFMLADTDRTSFKYDGDYYWTFDNAYVDGVKQSLNVSYDAVENLMGDSELLVPGVLYQVVKSLEDGKYITEIRYAGPETNEVVSVGNDSFRITTSPDGTTTNTEKFDVDDETVFVLVEPTWNWKDGWTFKISQSDLDDMFVGQNHEGYQIYVDVVERDGQNADLVYMTFCRPIANYDVNVTVDNAEVNIYGKYIDKTFTESDSFQVQAGTWVIVDAKANDGYAFEEDPSGVYFVGWGDLNIDATAVATGAQVTKAGEYADKVTMGGTTTINAEEGTTVTLTPADGYTITGVEAANVKASVDGKVWTVEVPAGSEDVVLNLTIVPDEYSFTTTDGKFDITVKTVAGEELTAGDDKLTIDVEYKVSVVAKTADAASNGYTLEVNGDKIDADNVTAGGVDQVAREFSEGKAAAEAYFAHGGTVYEDADCTQAYEGRDDLLAGSTFYYIETAAEAATAEYTFTVPYVAGGEIAFTMAQ